MYIKDIILDGFKCYENTTVLRNLDKSYNAVTGLNGSGKSNVIDAIVFALGLESKKLLRATTMKDLINVHRKDCKVTLVLSNTEKEKSPPGYRDYDEITISRFLDSTGKSKFYLNNHGCSNGTVAKLCASIGINSEKGESFFIIMQGHITKVLNMKSKEIGTLIEETAGTRSYTKEKDKALQVLEKKEIKLKDVRDAMERRISPFYDRLLEEREAYIEQKNVEEKKRRCQEEIEILQKKIEKNERLKAIKELKECLASLEEDSKSLREVEEKIAELQQEEYDGDNVEIREMLEDEKIRLEDLKRRNLEKEIEDREKEIKNLEVENPLKVSLAELKAKETVILKNLRSTGGIFGDSDKISKMEELTNLRNEKIEIECKINSIKVDRDFSEERIKEMENLRVDEGEFQNISNRLNYLKSKINYPFIAGVFGTVGESISLVDEKYKEAIFTVLGSKSKHIIVQDEVVGGSLLKSADRRISVIPLNKIRTKLVSLEVSKKVRARGGINALELIRYDLGLKKAIEHVFGGFFVFEDRGEAKKACFELGVYCVTLDGIVYDPKGTVTGGKSVYKVEIISRKEIERLEASIQRSSRFRKADYERLLRQREMARERNILIEKAKALDIKIETLAQITGGGCNLKKDLDRVRIEIVRVAAEEKKIVGSRKRREILEEEIKDLQEKKKAVDLQIGESRKKIEDLLNKLREREVKKSSRRMSEKQVEGLEPKQKFLIRAISKMNNRISKLREQLGEVDLEVEMEVEMKEELDLEEKLYKAQQTLRSLGARKSIKMDPSNFNLLEKYDLDIRNLKDKIKKIERDKSNILASITNFDTLGVKEIEKAFSHINKKLGDFLRYFIKDADAKITQNGERNYELKVKIGDWKDSLVELSGGQRSLVALCLVFSMLTYKPAPFYIFDEIDAALDLSYTQSIGEIIKKEFHNAQFIIISLKNGMYDNANSVYKVFIKDGKSKIAQIK
ncbi:Structural maintenance of chromosomes protein 2 [Nosema granulosis]|uniref:Structural maintenance of chromosomes protein 2 n=1 Tax=Nosema granulosis TaxID=83296 RepID=A0A9P6H024_9MICR|nr:Structural maintenance of chromosomes protein 2 [Nosema granulosis]